ncbi:PP2C family protein-serine/threonine phosphatase [Yinghuangia soli]|uniref:Serine/threonine-protein phosphatase n=1 Tax=Yinghuangia soli TaxID=2908204 RepID=A0AA41U3D8_9ACTN|nr:PP2C family protein-serine/threonine phosphatase [Yinghuangia soli]MCF2527969.1 serine/threonine-protein phosphatase [Yinghuangia soli]
MQERPQAGTQRRGAPVGGVWAGLLVLLAAAAVFDLSTPPQYTAGPFLAAAPAIAVGTLPFRQTCVLVAATAAIAGALTLQDRDEFHGHGVVDLIGVLVVCVTCLVLARLRSRDARQLASLHTLAELLQDCVVRTPPARAGNLACAGRYRAARSEARIGGDAYAVEDTVFGVRVVVADVRGKGLGAIEAVSVLLGAFREAAHYVGDFAHVVHRTELSLDREGLRRGGIDAAEGFTTAVFAEIPHGAAELRILNRGHPGPVLVGPDGSVRVLEPGTYELPLTLPRRLLGRTVPPQDDAALDQHSFPVGATLLLFTDGVTEARDAAGTFLDPAAALAGRRFADPDSAADALLSAVAQWTGDTLDDDVAIVAVTHRPPGDA